MTPQDPPVNEQIYSILFKASRLSSGVRVVNEDEWPIDGLSAIVALAKQEERTRIKHELFLLPQYRLLGPDNMPPSIWAINMSDVKKALSATGEEGRFIPGYTMLPDRKRVRSEIEKKEENAV